MYLFQILVHFIIEMIWWTGLAPWEFEFSSVGSWARETAVRHACAEAVSTVWVHLPWSTSPQEKERITFAMLPPPPREGDRGVWGG